MIMMRLVLCLLLALGTGSASAIPASQVPSDPARRPAPPPRTQTPVPARSAADIKQARWVTLEKSIQRYLGDFRAEVGLIIKDLETGRTIQRNPDKPFPSASMVKIPIMAACFKAVEDGRVSLQDVIMLRAADRTRGSGVLRASPAGTPVTVEKLIELMITDSDNTAANLLIDLLGFEYINTSFKEFGLDHTNLSRKMMDFRARWRGVENYTTARDMAEILEKTYRGTCVSPRACEMGMAILKGQKVNDRIPRYLPRTIAVAHKTGLENKVVHDAGILFTAHGDVLICVLTEGDTGAVIAKRVIGRLAALVYRAYK